MGVVPVISREEPVSRSYVSQRTRLHFVTWGDPANPPLLLVHGSRDNCRNWDIVAAHFSSEWYVVAPDLRGHGDSGWSADGSYALNSFVFDIAQLIDQQIAAPVTIVAHSMGGNIALRYTGLYPDLVRRLVVVEGVYPPRVDRGTEVETIAEQMLSWIGRKRRLAGRVPRRYASVADAIERIRKENPSLSGEQAAHLGVHGVAQNEDGTFSWKFDNYVRIFAPVDIREDQERVLWSRINCPTLLIHGDKSWVPHPSTDGRTSCIRAVEIRILQEAGHWPQHDHTREFTSLVEDFIRDRAAA